MSHRSISSPILALCCLAVVANAETATDMVSRQVREVFEKSRAAVVRVEAEDDHGKLAGTGFFVCPDGTLFTSYTIVGNSERITVRVDQREYTAERLFADPRSGIAMLKVKSDEPFPFLTAGSSSKIPVATPVMVVGYPLEFGVTPAFGIVGGMEMKHLDRYFCTAHIRASIAVQGGQGGAPLLSLDGQVLGILISSVPGGGGAFALPIEAAEKVRRDYMRFGEPRPGYIGAVVGNMPEALGGSRAKIEQLDESGPAVRSGLLVGDVVLSVAGRPVACPEDVISAAFYTSSGDEIPVVVQRKNERITLAVSAADHPGSKKRAALSGEHSLLPEPASTAVSAPGIPIAPDP